MNCKNPILVTGAHRSGTTFVGKVLSFSQNIAYIHEPFNVENHISLNNENSKLWFQYITNSNEDKYINQIDDILNYRNVFTSKIFFDSSIKGKIKLIHNFIGTLNNKIVKKRPLIKDPIAIFSAPWLSKGFNMDVVVMIRHPAAFASSLKHLNWSHNFNHFLLQPLLIKDYLQPYQNDIKEFANNKHTIIEQAALLWKIIYSTVYQYKLKYPDWVYLRHEDLSENPLEEFKTLYKKLDLDFTSRVERKILNYTNFSMKTDPIYDDPFTLKRNSKTNKTLWKSRLTEDEIIYIKSQVGEISSKFYTEDEW